MERGSHHDAATREAISAAMRARFQRRREAASLTLVAIDDALRLMQEAETRIARLDRLPTRRNGDLIIFDGSLEAAVYDEAVAASRLAVDAMETASHLIRTFDPEPEP